MAISYPLSIPTSIGIGEITFRAVNAVSTSQSPFTYKQQIVAHQGQRWEADIRIPPVKRDLAEEWVAFLLSLKGKQGTFTLYDPNATSPRGTVSSCTLSGSAGDDSVTVVMTGSLLAGDYIQLGSGSSARLHKVLQDQTGDGTLEIWPQLRDTYSSASVTTDTAKGVFRLSENMTAWTINDISSYGIQFSAVEAIA